MSDLAGQRMLVVGGSSGVGRAMVRGARQAGAIVGVAARRLELLETLQAECGCLIRQVDIADPECGAAIDDLARRLGGVDQLVITAAVVPMIPLRSMTAADWAQLMAVNCIGPNLVISAAFPHLTPDAQVLVVSSDSSGAPWHSLAGYAASKSALDDSLRAWRVEHPELRVTRVTLAATSETDISRGMDPSVAAVAIPQWIVQGRLLANQMTTDDVALQLLSILAAGVAAPETVIDDLMLRPRGGLMGSATSTIEQVEQQAFLEGTS